MSVVLAACLLAGPMPGRALAAEEGGVESVPAAEETVPGAGEDGTAAEEVGTAAEEDGTAAPAPEDMAPSEEDPAESGAAPYAAASSGTCGENLVWTLDEAGTLTISGTGEMERRGSWGSEILAVVIEAGVTTICDNAFYHCFNLRSVTFPESLTTIGEAAFMGCRELVGVTFPESLTTIGNSAFSNCVGLTVVTIPRNVTAIGEAAFATCRRLTGFTVADGNTAYASVDGILFNYARTELLSCPCNRSGSYTIPEGVTAIGGYAFIHCNALTDITISEGVTTIGACAFSLCTSLTNIMIPKSAISISGDAFYLCSSLTAITVADGNTTYASVDGILFDCAKKTLVIFPGAKWGRTPSRTAPTRLANVRSRAARV